MVKKIKNGMTMKDVVIAMSEGNPGAASVIMSMLRDPITLPYVSMLDDMDIRGAKIYMLYNDCSQRNLAKFKRTLELLRSGGFTQEQIHLNLDPAAYATPYVDDSIEMDGVPPYGEEFDMTHPKWDEWSKVQKESFYRRFSSEKNRS